MSVVVFFLKKCNFLQYQIILLSQCTEKIKLIEKNHTHNFSVCIHKQTCDPSTPQSSCINGDCIKKPTTSTYICECPAGFKFDFSESKCMNMCENVTCQNGGFCIYDYSLDSTECLCSGDFYGEFCQTGKF